MHTVRVILGKKKALHIWGGSALWMGDYSNYFGKKYVVFTTQDGICKKKKFLIFL